MPDPSSPTYAEAVAAFYRGVAAAQVGESGLAAAAFQRVTELVPREPAGWANLGLISLQRRELEQAADALAEAGMLAPENDHIQLVSALVERDRGRLDTAAAHLRHAIELDTQNLQALYLLAQLVEQENRPGSAVEAQQQIDRILAVQPGNLVALLERARLAAKVRAIETLRQTLDRIEIRAEALSFALSDELREVLNAAEAGQFNRAATQIAFLQTGLQRLPAYRDDEDAVLTSPSRTDLLLTQFLRLPTPSAQSAPPDTSLTFVPETLSVGEGPVAWVRATWLNDEVPLALIAASRGTLWVSTEPGQAEAFALPGGASAELLSPSAVAPVDYNYDFQTDLVVAGPGGLRLLRQDRTGSFTDVTGEAVAPAIARAAYAGAWAADLDMEGDLDLVVARVAGAPVVLRNRGDGTFERYPAFAGVTRLRDFVWADLDADGDPDAALLDAAGRLQVFLNGRYRDPQFQPYPLPDTLGSVHAIAASDLNQDATLDLILLESDGTLSRVSLDESGWDAAVLARWPDYSATEAQSTQLYVADLDNNGDLDLVTSTLGGARVWLSTASGLRPLSPIDIQITGVADVSGEGRLDLIAARLNSAWTVPFGQMMRATSTSGDSPVPKWTVGASINCFW
jgi:tetratricopeptide (TPR) repeat protein